MPALDDVRSFLAHEHGLAVVSTTQKNGRVLSSVINCGVMDHPVTGAPCAAFVAVGGSARLAHIRRGSPVTLVARRGWQWVGVTGAADLIGPSDPADGFDADRLRVLIRDIFTAAGGTHDDWDEYDRVMAADARVAVFVAAERINGNMPTA